LEDLQLVGVASLSRQVGNGNGDVYFSKYLGKSFSVLGGAEDGQISSQRWPSYVPHKTEKLLPRYLETFSLN